MLLPPPPTVFCRRVKFNNRAPQVTTTTEKGRCRRGAGNASHSSLFALNVLSSPAHTHMTDVHTYTHDQLPKTAMIYPSSSTVTCTDHHYCRSRGKVNPPLQSVLAYLRRATTAGNIIIVISQTHVLGVPARSNVLAAFLDTTAI